jgi:hypothetical protein
MSPATIQFIITAAIFLHGLAHGRAAAALLIQAGGKRLKDWLPMRTWLVPSLEPKIAALIAAFFWVPSTLGFLAAALVLWGILSPGADWRTLALASAVLSTLGSLIFSGVWPGAPNRKLSNLDTTISLVINAAIILVLQVFGWQA